MDSGNPMNGGRPPTFGVPGRPISETRTPIFGAPHESRAPKEQRWGGGGPRILGVRMGAPIFWGTRGGPRDWEEIPKLWGDQKTLQMRGGPSTFGVHVGAGQPMQEGDPQIWGLFGPPVGEGDPQLFGVHMSPGCPINPQVLGSTLAQGSPKRGDPRVVGCVWEPRLLGSIWGQGTP